MNKSVFTGMVFALAVVVQAQGDGLLATSFENDPRGFFSELHNEAGRWHTTNGKTEITAAYAKSGRQSLRLFGGTRTVLELMPAFGGKTVSHLSFWAERWTAREPFQFRIYAQTEQGWRELYNGDDAIQVGLRFLSHVKIALPPQPVLKFRFVCASPEETGILIDDVVFHQPIPARIEQVTTLSPVAPVLIRKPHNPLLAIQIDVVGSLEPRSVKQIDFSTKPTTNPDDIASIDVFYTGNENRFSTDQPFSTSAKGGGHVIVSADQELVEGANYFWVSYTLRPSADLLHRAAISDVRVRFDNGDEAAALSEPIVRRIGYNLRDAGDDGVPAYRIPGLATTNRGTLIAVYDIRRHGMGDLPGDIDVGMSRSTDGGQTWEPMKIILDMGPPHNQNGVGDPSVLVDKITGTIWVAALWSKGNRAWHGSGPGMTPDETGQFVLTKSTDDGVTWSQPINITEQIKDPKWRLVFNGPGNGITMRDGTLVFPAQFKDEHNMPHSTIIYSQDRGRRWAIGTGAKPNTTEAQVAELSDGSLMLNMRDNRGGSRSVYTTGDLGTTWQVHPSSRSALPEPVCMASLIRFSRKQSDQGDILLFSNPAVSSGPRRNLTLKASLDEGLTWPPRYHKLLHEPASAGYSCLTQIDDQFVGILYEGGATALLVFEKVHIDEIIGSDENVQK